MELEFDKEMDALLRKTAKSGAAAAPVLDSHLDADEISMFAENALPDTARPRVVSHMADCERCRTILSNVIVLNAESETAPAAVPAAQAEKTTAETQSGSWLSGLFTTRNLAFGFGAMALLFAGFLGFAVVQNMNSGGADMAKADADSMNSSAPVAQEAMSSNTAGSSNSNAEVFEQDGENAVTDSKSAEAPSILVPDNTAVTGKERVRAATDPADDTFADRRDISGRRENMAVADKNKEMERDETLGAVAESRPAPPPAPLATVVPGNPKDSVLTPRSGVTRQAEPKKAEKRDQDLVGAAASKSESAGRKINGKTFTQRNGVWYDSAYKNQPTRTVKRGTADFQSLDAGVRSIADQLNGTVVVVWKTKALKIQ